MRRTTVCALVMLVVVSPLGWGQSDADSAAPAGEAAEEAGPAEGTGEAESEAQSGAGAAGSDEASMLTSKRLTAGLIFNASNLLLDLEEYQGGAGLKLAFPRFALRGLLAVELTNMGISADDAVDVSLGLSAEFPFFQGRITPYWGGFVDGTISQEESETSAGTTETQVISGAVGPLLGAEVFIFPFFSVFGEYALSFRASRSTIDQASGGKDKTNNYTLGTELGNAGSLGLVIYLERRPMSMGDGEDGVEGDAVPPEPR